MPKPRKSAAPDNVKGQAGAPRGRGVTARQFGDAMDGCLRDRADFGRNTQEISAIAVGCSGGPDSMTLTLLLKDWAAARGIPLTALVVDHGLRPEAAAEAARVAGWLAERGVNASVLTHEGETPRRNIQAEARRMRYDLMRDWCVARDVPVLAVAHHLEDQAETFLLRLARGSGVDGLSAMAPVSAMPGDPYGSVTLIRPLLDFSREDLHAALAAAQWPSVDDPSNRDIRHARVRMRNLAAALAMEGLDPPRLTRTAKAMRRARIALEKATTDFIDAHAAMDPYGYARLDRRAFLAAPDETAMRALTRLLQLVSGADHPFRLDRLEKLTAALRAEHPPGPRNLGGCRVETRGENILIFREASAIGPAVPARRTLFWDRRFRLDVQGVLDDLTVDRLGAEGVRQARAARLTDDRFEQVPGPARAALPGLWRGDVLVAVAAPDAADAEPGTAGADVPAARFVFEGMRRGGAGPVPL